MTFPRSSALYLALAGALALGACNKQPTPPPAPAAAPAPASTPAAPPPAAPATPAPAPADATTLNSVTLSTTPGGASMTQFGPKDTIYANVATQSSGGTATISATWTFGDGLMVNSSDQQIAATGPATTTFHVNKPDGWPVGKYHLQISIDGKAVNSTDFEVK